MWLTIAVIALCIICHIIDGDSILAKLVLALVVAAVACLLIYVFTEWYAMLELAKLGGAGAIILTVIAIVKKIFGSC